MSFNSLFYPKSVAVIGASTDEGSVGNEIARNLSHQGYKGHLFLVNKKGGKLFGQKLIVDLKDIKEPIDLAIIAIPAAAVVEEVKRLATLGARAIVVISAGFKEVGNREAQDELARECAQNKITLIGPNCIGVINPQIKLNASFAPLMPNFGPVAFISQSGAICASVLDYAKKRDLGFSKFVSVGNKALIGEDEILEYLYADKYTKVIAMYVEELEDAQFLRKIVSKITHGKHHKPIIVLKAGRTQQGRRAALSHTGSMGSSDEAYEALFAQTGMIRAETLEELFDFIECFARNDLFKEDRVAVITNAGGPGVIGADALVASGLTLAELSVDAQNKLRKILPPAAAVANPVDILGDADAKLYEATIKIVLADPKVDGLQIILTPQSMTEVETTARAIVRVKKQSKKPLIVTFMGQGLVEKGLDILYENEIATGSFPESAARALASLRLFQKWVSRRIFAPKHFASTHPGAVRQILNEYLFRGQKLLSLDASFSVLSAYGFPVSKHWMITNSEDALRLSGLLKGLFSLKIVSVDINHKSDVGGVVLDVEADNLLKEYKKLIDHIKKVKPAAQILGVEVMPMASDEGLEMILGVTTDAALGKQILVGFGGIWAEVIGDNSWGLAPLTSADIERMIAHLKISKILSGLRGRGPLAEDVVAKSLGRLSQLVCDFEQIKEVDINPIKVFSAKKGAMVLDARIVLA